MPLVIAGATSGSTTVQATDAVTATITLPSATGTVQLSGAAASFTDLTTTGNTILGNASTDTLNVGNGGLVKDASGNVGIGVPPSPWSNSSNLELAGNIALAANQGYRFNNYYNLGDKSIAAGYAATAYFNTTAGIFEWQSSNSSAAGAGSAVTLVAKMTLSANGNLALQGATTTATGVGITFPATQSASTNANCLDDYEEGTFSPTISGYSGTYTTRSGAYTKIGRQVFANGVVIITANTGSFTGYPGIDNLPFTGSYGVSSSSANGVWCVVTGSQSLPTGYLSSGTFDGPANGGTGGFPNVFVANANASNWEAAWCNPAVAFQLRFSITYFTD
jgi:hypothetical protein